MLNQASATPTAIPARTSTHDHVMPSADSIATPNVNPMNVIAMMTDTS